jgi:hypothetical protein
VTARVGALHAAPDPGRAEDAPCRWPEHRERGLDWQGQQGRTICGVCHPQPARLEAELHELIDADPGAVDVPPAEDQAAASGLPAIRTNARPLRDVTADAISALQVANDPPALFTRSGAISRVRRDEDDRPRIEQVGEAELRGHLARAADFQKTRQEGAPVPVTPPLDVVRDVLSRPSWPFPPLEAVTETPALRPDGSVLVEPGYDPATRLLYLPRPGLPLPDVPESPSPSETQAALELLDDAIADFPFVDEASRAGALALMLTPVVRPAICGQVPIAVLDSTKAGSGKGLLAGLVAEIATGRPAAVLPAPTREEEWAKTVGAVLMGGATFVLLDETRELSSPSLAAALTSRLFEARLLGRSEIVQVPQRATWAAAGNNVQLGGDLARRGYWIRLDAKMSRPWQRRGFRHPDLLGWAAEHRGELLSALLTLARGWFAAGRPDADVPPLGGFDEWARMIGGILAAAGVKGFLDNLDDFYDQADQEAVAWERFFATWLGALGAEPVTVGDLAKAVAEEGPLRDALPDDDLADRLGKPAAFRSKMGKALAARNGTRFGDAGLRVEKAGEDPRSRAASWRVQADQDLAEVQRSQRSGGYSYADAGGKATDGDRKTSATSTTSASRGTAEETNPGEGS